MLDLTLSRPERRNALGDEEWCTLEDCLNKIQTDSIDIIRITGTGSVFCAGVDLEMLGAARQEPGGVEDMVSRISAIIERLSCCSAIVIVAVNGPAVGVGVHLALAADILVASKNTYFHLPEARMGLPDVLNHRVLAERLGRSRATGFSLLGDRLTAEEAIQAGFAYRLCSTSDDLPWLVDEITERLLVVPVSVRSAFKRQSLNLIARGSPGYQEEAVRWCCQQG